MTASGSLGSASGRVSRWFVACAVLSFAGVFAAYANHFHNSFHFDDGSVIQNNAYLRSLRNIPRFFTDASTFSSWPANAEYRPLTSVSFALDYWRGKGLDSFAFHVTQWGLHVATGVLVFFFLKQVLAGAGLSSRSLWLALFGATLFLLHPVNTEAVNYLCQRSEILAAAGVLGSFVLYQMGRRFRRSLVWLLPATLGAFAKQSALIFAPLFAIDLMIFPEEHEAGRGTPERRRFGWLAASAPAFVVAFFLYGLQSRLAGPHLLRALVSPAIYLKTQTFAWLHYFRLFLLPLGLSADADWAPIGNWYDTRVFAGVSFAVLFVSAGFLYARRRPAGKAFLFGSLWFFLTLAPSSSLVPLSEMVNEHRPYPAYIGLILCLTAAAGDWFTVLATRRGATRAQWLVASFGILVLAAHGVGTFERNRVWSTEETLWRSVTETSPANGRAWMNYGLIFMARADYGNARACFERAQSLVPNYDVLEVNLGILDGASNRPVEAERHFQRALSLNSNTVMANFYYGRWLHENRRDREAVPYLVTAIAGSPADLEARHLLMRVYRELEERDSVCSLARETLRIAPEDRESAGVVGTTCPPR